MGYAMVPVVGPLLVQSLWFYICKVSWVMLIYLLLTDQSLQVVQDLLQRAQPAYVLDCLILRLMALNMFCH